MSEELKALERVRDWLRYDVPIGTPSATTMLTFVNEEIERLRSPLVGSSSGSNPSDLPTE